MIKKKNKVDITTKMKRIMTVSCAVVIVFSSAPVALAGIPEQDCADKGWVWSDGECVKPATSVDLDESTADCKEKQKSSGDIADNCIVRRMVDIINFLSVGIGMLAIGAIMFGGFMYVTSDSNPQKIAAARGYIMNAILGILAYIFLYAILNWLIPGGLIA